MTLFKFIDKNIIFGIPLFLLDNTFFVSVLDMKSKFLYYLPRNPEDSINFNAALTCTLLKFNMDFLTEYQDIGEKNKLIDREYKIIENIKHVESSIINLIVYNIKYHSFSLN